MVVLWICSYAQCIYAYIYVLMHASIFVNMSLHTCVNMYAYYIYICVCEFVYVEWICKYVYCAIYDPASCVQGPAPINCLHIYAWLRLPYICIHLFTIGIITISGGATRHWAIYVYMHACMHAYVYIYEKCNIYI